MKFWYNVKWCIARATKADKVMPLGWYEITAEMFKELV